MQYEIDLDANTQVVRVRIDGDPTDSEHLTILEQVVKNCERTGVPKLLVDLRHLRTSTTTTLSCLDFGTTIAKRLPGAFIAHVLPKEHDARGDVRFASTVACNRGCQTGEFDSIEAATAWLHEQE